MEPNVWKLFGACALFLAGLIWFGIATIYEFKYQIPICKVKPDYAEWKLKSARFLFRVCLIGSQVAGWLSLGVMVFVFLIYPGFMYSLEELHFDDMNQVHEDALLLMKVYVYGFSIFYGIKNLATIIKMCRSARTSRSGTSVPDKEFRVN